MKLHVVSDLHLHFGKFDLPETDADYILIAGDLDNGRKATNWLTRQSRLLNKPIILVLGNHEYYNKIFEEQIPMWRSSLEGYDITILDWRTNPFIRLDKDTILMGDTLWTDMNKKDIVTMHMAKYSMADFNCILKQYSSRFFSAEDSANECAQALDAFRAVRDDHWEDKLIIMTHHAPHLDSIHDKYAHQGNINHCFVSNLEEVMEELRADVWIHGHTHTNFDYRTGMCDTRVVCNPRGYYRVEDNIEWNPNLVIEV